MVCAPEGKHRMAQGVATLIARWKACVGWFVGWPMDSKIRHVMAIEHKNHIPQCDVDEDSISLGKARRTQIGLPFLSPFHSPGTCGSRSCRGAQGRAVARARRHTVLCFFAAGESAATLAE
jgi:hypothetical protein